MVDINGIPNELIKNGKWVVRNDKVPYNPKTNRKANTKEINTFTDFETAYNCYIDNNYSGIGIGIFGNFYAIDLDHCITDGVLSKSAEIIVEAFASYTEISPSGDGLHILGYINDFTFDKDRYYIHNQKQNIEVYIAGVTSKYVTVTGNRYNDYDISTCENSTMQIFLDKFMQREIKSDMLLPALPDVNTDIDYLTIGLEKDEKLKRYYNGERILTDKSESENDLGFMSKLMYWCNNSREKALNAFLTSPYSLQKDEEHTKKLQRKDYIDNLLKTAFQVRTAYSDNANYGGNKRLRNNNTEYNLITAKQLHSAEFAELKYFVDDILPEGTTILAAAPKSGKSWFVLDLALKISANGAFLGKHTTQTGVLYLALEDSNRRLQARMKKILSDSNVPNGMYFITNAPNIDNGFIPFIEKLLKEHSDIKLVIIDTFQKIRGQAQPRELLYQYDYREMGLLKQFADSKGISLLFVHHTRKMKDKDDPNNMISGSNGISGAVDTILVMTKNSRDEEETQLHISGRDVNSNTMIIKLDKLSCEWKTVGNLQEIEAKKEREEFYSNPVVKVILHLLDNSNNDEWTGFAKDIVEAGKNLNLEMPDSTKVGYIIRNLTPQFDKYFIRYEKIKRGKTNIVRYKFKYISYNS